MGRDRTRVSGPVAGTDFPLDARILAVADAVDAMTSDRSYRPAPGHDEASDRLAAERGPSRPRCVRACLEREFDSGAAERVAPTLGLPGLGVGSPTV